MTPLATTAAKFRVDPSVPAGVMDGYDDSGRLVVRIACDRQRSYLLGDTLTHQNVVRWHITEEQARHMKAVLHWHEHGWYCVGSA